MVELADYELNHIFPIDNSNVEVPIGETDDVNVEEIELFKKSLALTSDIKRLPILRGFNVAFSVSPKMATLMNDSGCASLRVVLTIHNCAESQISAENRLGSCTLIVQQTGGSFVMISKENMVWDFEGGALLNPVICTRLFMDFKAAIATNALTAGIVSAIGELEIDWAPVSKAKFKDFILESVYAEGITDD